MSADEYVPSDEDMREDHVQDRANPDAGRRQWDAWLAAHDARVRRDAAREALDGVADDVRADWHRSHHWVTQPIEEYRDTHYPIPEETS